MSTLIEDSCANNIDPEAEVKKLKDLVKKLEVQNQQLRNKQNDREKQPNVNLSVARSTPKSDLKNPSSPGVNVTDLGLENHLTGGVQDVSSLDDVELLDVTCSVSDEEEDSW